MRYTRATLSILRQGNHAVDFHTNFTLLLQTKMPSSPTSQTLEGQGMKAQSILLVCQRKAVSLFGLLVGLGKSFVVNLL